MFKVLFFDLGGVVFYDFFSGGIQKFVQVLNLPKQKIYTAYVKTDFVDYFEGRLSDYKRFKAMTDKLNLGQDKVQVCIDAFYKEYHPVNETISFIKKIKITFPELKVGVLSDQPAGVCKMLRKKYPQVFKLFNKDILLISAEVGLSKQAENLDFYKLAIKKSKVKPTEILFIDNFQRNIINAKKLGFKTFFFDIENIKASNLVNKLAKVMKNDH